MNIAFCFSGGVRNFEDTFPGIKTNLLDVYNYATNEQYISLYVNLVAKDIGNMFYKTFKELRRIDDD